jgi:integrase
MSVSQLPSGRWRAQTYDPATKRYVSSAKVLGMLETTFSTAAQARRADAKASEALADRRPKALTLAAWADIWTTDPLYERNKASTNIHNHERIRRFVEKYGSVPLAAFEGERGDQIVGEWIAGGKNLSTVPVLKAMFNDAASAKAGRRIRSNPFVGVATNRGKGRAGEDPPSEEQVAGMIGHAHQITAPGFAAWLEVAAWSGMRPGELDAMRWDWVDFTAGRIDVKEQWNFKARDFTLPKNDKTRVILLTPQARAALLRAPKESSFCFTNLQGNHWRTSSRTSHWDRVRTMMGWLEKDSRKALYLCTRHFAGWYLYNVLELPAEDVAIQLGHEDGGELVRVLYGHRDRKRTLARIESAFAAQIAKDRQDGRTLRIVEGNGA